MKIKCSNCNETINRKPSYLAKTKEPACSRVCASSIQSRRVSANQLREKNPYWKGGIRQRNGYIQILKPEHLFCDKKGYVFEHRLVVEKNIGRYLKKDEVIHHEDGNKKNNKINNLKIMKQGEHFSAHLKTYWKDKIKNTKNYFKKCIVCKKLYHRSDSYYKYLVNKENANCCSKKCQATLLVKEIKLICPICKKLFFRSPSQFKKVKTPTCSFKCSHKVRNKFSVFHLKTHQVKSSPV